MIYLKTTKTRGRVSWICARDDYAADVAEAQERAIGAVYEPAAAEFNLDFEFLDASTLVPDLVDGRPRLFMDGQDLLEERQCFLVSNFSWRPQTDRFLQAICRAIDFSDSVLLNRSAGIGADWENDKFAMMAAAARAGARTIPTVQLPYGVHMRKAIPHVTARLGSGPYIVKPRSLGMGYAVTTAKDDQELLSLVDLAAQSGCDFLVQKRLKIKGDLRVYTLDGKVIASLLRTPQKGGHLANLHQGGRAQEYEPSADVAELSQQFAQHLGAEYLAIDWLLSTGGFVFNEFSTAITGMLGVPEPKRSDVARQFFRWIARKFDDVTQND